LEDELEYRRLILTAKRKPGYTKNVIGSAPTISGFSGLLFQMESISHQEGLSNLTGNDAK
jgi:hypothetical protein